MDKRILDPIVSVVGSRFLPMSSTAEVLDLDVGEALVAAAAERRQADRSEARLLTLAVQIVHLFPVNDDTPVACWRDPLLTVPDEDDPILDHLAGHGTPMVAERARRGARRRPRHLLRLCLSAWSRERWSCATACPDCGHWSRTGRCRRGRPARSPSRPRTSARGGRIRRPAGRDRRREEPDRAEPDRARPPGAGAVRTRQGPPAGGSGAGTPRRHLRLRRRRHSAPPPSPRPWMSWTPTTSTPPSVTSQTSWAASATSHPSVTAAPQPSVCWPTRNAFSTCSANRPRTRQRKKLAITGATLYVHLTGDDLRRTAEDGETSAGRRREARHRHPRPPQGMAPTVLRHHREAGVGHEPGRRGRSARPT